MTEHQRYVVVGEGEKWQVVGLMGFLGTAGKLQSSFLQNMKWEQHNILKPDKSNVLIICITAIDSLSLSDRRSRSKGSHETQKPTHSFLKHTGTHQVSGGNLF